MLAFQDQNPQVGICLGHIPFYVTTTWKLYLEEVQPYCLPVLRLEANKEANTIGGQEPDRGGPAIH